MTSTFINRRTSCCTLSQLSENLQLATAAEAQAIAEAVAEAAIAAALEKERAAENVVEGAKQTAAAAEQTVNYWYALDVSYTIDLSAAIALDASYTIDLSNAIALDASYTIDLSAAIALDASYTIDLAAAIALDASYTIDLSAAHYKLSLLQQTPYLATTALAMMHNVFTRIVDIANEMNTLYHDILSPPLYFDIYNTTNLSPWNDHFLVPTGPGYTAMNTITGYFTDIYNYINTGYYKYSQIDGLRSQVSTTSELPQTLRCQMAFAKAYAAYLNIKYWFNAKNRGNWVFSPHEPFGSYNGANQAAYILANSWNSLVDVYNALAYINSPPAAPVPTMTIPTNILDTTPPLADIGTTTIFYRGSWNSIDQAPVLPTQAGYLYTLNPGNPYVRTALTGVGYYANTDDDWPAWPTPPDTAYIVNPPTAPTDAYPNTYPAMPGDEQYLSSPPFMPQPPGSAPTVTLISQPHPDFIALPNDMQLEINHFSNTDLSNAEYNYAQAQQHVTDVSGHLHVAQQAVTDASNNLHAAQQAVTAASSNLLDASNNWSQAIIAAQIAEQALTAAEDALTGAENLLAQEQALLGSLVEKRVAVGLACINTIVQKRNLLIAEQNVNIIREDVFNSNTTNVKLQAGGRYITTFPSLCFQDTLEETLLKKKAYMFKNNNNVLSGPIKNTLYFGGTSGTGLTRNKQLSNMARGLLPNGTPGIRLGVQSYQNNSLYSNSNIYNNSGKGIYGRTIIEPSNYNRQSIKILICKK
jgi:hypothetical protein